MLPVEVLPKVCSARAAANESVCEDLIGCKAESLAISVLTIAEVILEI